VSNASSVPADREIVASRLLAHAPSKVFQAFRNPATLATWWGPDGFTNTFYEFDFRAGGAWRFTMHSPDGKDFLNDSRFVEIVEPSRIVLDHLSSPHFQADITIHPTDEGCRLDWRMIFEDSKTRENVAKFAVDGLEQNLNRLSAALNDPQT